MKILMVASYLPYPLFSGGHVRLYNLIKELSAHHEITLICEKRSSQTEQDRKEVEKICKKVITVSRRKQWSMQNVLNAASSTHSFLMTGHTLPAMQKILKEVLEQETFDLIHVETFYVMQNLPKTKIPIVLVEHNIEYLVYEKFKKRMPLPLRPILALDIAKIRREEESFWTQATSLVAVSNDDKRVMEQSGFTPSLVSNGVNTDEFRYKNIKKSLGENEKKILFIGDFKWIQNTDSATFIIKEIWPRLRQKIAAQGSLKLWIVGRKIPGSIRSLTTDSSVLFDEESSSRLTPELFQEATILLAPIRVGGGTSYKILEAMSCGTPVVTMQLSADALEAQNGQAILVGKDAEELGEKTKQLLEDKALYEKISKNGRKLIEEKYTWKVIAKNLENVYTKSVQR
jgi:glycosyltransferase involved in cell wall biosynthesis